MQISLAYTFTRLHVHSCKEEKKKKQEEREKKASLHNQTIDSSKTLLTFAIDVSRVTIRNCPEAFSTNAFSIENA